MSFFNQHSFTILSLLAFVILAFILLRDGVAANDIIALLALALGLGIAFLFFRPGKSTSDQAQEVSAQIGAGQPVLLEFQSNY
jgi:uncharacterized membrane protein